MCSLVDTKEKTVPLCALLRIAHYGCVLGLMRKTDTDKTHARAQKKHTMQRVRVEAET